MHIAIIIYQFFIKSFTRESVDPVSTIIISKYGYEVFSIIESMHFFIYLKLSLVGMIIDTNGFVGITYFLRQNPNAT